MTAHVALTQKAIERARPADPGRRYVIWDQLVTGFGLRVTDSGVKSFIVMKRLPGAAQPIRRTLGEFPTLGLGKARELARDAVIEIKGGVDPKIRQLKERREEERKRQGTVENIVETFIEKYAKRQTRSWGETKRIFDVYVLPRWKGREIGSIGRLDVTELLDAIEDRNGPVMADRTLAAIRKFFNWHAARDDHFMSPVVKGMARTKPKERARDRVLNDDEIQLIWSLLDEFKPVFGPLVRFLLLTGQRRDEAAGLRWDQIKKRDDGQVWEIPAESYKTKRPHVVPLSSMSLAIAEAQPRHTLENGDPAPYLFTTLGDAPFQGFAKCKARLDARVLEELQKAARDRGDDASKVKPPPRWTLHDLRRTAKTLMTRSGVAHFHADRVLGHVIPGVGGVYDRHDYLAEKREALNVLAKAIERTLAPDQVKTMPFKS